MRILLTGGAGFIGSHVLEKLLSLGNDVVVIDNFDPFYNRSYKDKNIATAKNSGDFRFIEGDICSSKTWELLADEKFDAIIHLAAKAGVRPSMIDPVEYNRVNVLGTTYLLQFAREKGIKKILFASSSSVYGVNKNLPWSVEDKQLQPISIYAYSKLAGEQLCEYYHNFFGIKIIALRFFTVIGPRQRPDLAVHKFVKAIIEDKTVTLFGNGQTFRDYTYIQDIVNGVIGALNYDNDTFEIFNLGNTKTVSLLDLVNTIEEVLQKKAKIEFLPEQQGDVPYTWSNIEKSQNLLNFFPRTELKEGISEFINWYKTL